MPRYQRQRYQPRLKKRTRRAVLNTTSVKKQDSLIPASNSENPEATPTAGGLVVRPNPFFFSPTPTAGAPTITIWTPYARRLLVGADAGANHSRNASEIFARGVSERVTMDFNDGAAWRWRRLVFCLKGDVLRTGNLPTTYYEADAGADIQTRLLRPITMSDKQSSTSFQQYVALRNLLFTGGVTIDWLSLFTAKVDESRVTLISDKVRTLRSGNEQPRVLTRKYWTPCNKMINYEDNESGATNTTSRWSTSGKPGMGDLYIVDIFGTSQSTNPGSRLNFIPESTVYWHEK